MIIYSKGDYNYHDVYEYVLLSLITLCLIHFFVHSRTTDKLFHILFASLIAFIFFGARMVFFFFSLFTLLIDVRPTPHMQVITLWFRLRINLPDTIDAIL